MVEILGNLNQIFEYLSGHAVWWGLLLLGLSAVIEYVIPPFPGDSVTLAGAVLIPQAGWPVWGVFGAVMAGTAVGATIDWRIGMWLSDNEKGNTWLHRWLQSESVAPKVDKLHEQFDKWGSVYISLNRFVPAFRALFFLAAGLSRLELWKVLLFGSLSAALWNGAILGLGYGVGYKLETLASIIDTYSRLFFIGLIALAIIWLAKTIYDFVKIAKSQ